ncbi:hypothetical protein ASZ78_004208 [Callipepla squamata]|uniref:Uncharacterized protein n=1 Tax=Callipepla squamata TaxID=9009 RepID=A0A226MET0_CALSU|nr:hypothetical protein ASZ78_004208 [Callipepla squamata]
MCTSLGKPKDNTKTLLGSRGNDDGVKSRAGDQDPGTDMTLTCPKHMMCAFLTCVSCDRSAHTTDTMPNGGCGCCGGNNNNNYTVCCYSSPRCCKTPCCYPSQYCCSMPCCMPMTCCYTLSNNNSNSGCCGCGN